MYSNTVAVSGQTDFSVTICLDIVVNDFHMEQSQAETWLPTAKKTVTLILHLSPTG